VAHGESQPTALTVTHGQIETGSKLLSCWKTQYDKKIIKRVAALDIGKAELVRCVRVLDEAVPGSGCRRSRPIPR
jgi:hypothetical protein